MALFQFHTSRSKRVSGGPAGARVASLFLLLALLLAGCEGSPPGGGLRATAAPVTTAVTPETSTAKTAPAPATRPPATPTVAPTETTAPSPRPTATATGTATASPQPAGPPTGTPTSTPQASPTVSATVDPSLAAYPRLQVRPGDAQPYLSRFRLVSYYGAAGEDTLGILNLRSPSALVAGLRALAAEYQALDPQHEVLPTLHTVVTVADPWFGEDRNFNHRASLEAIEGWLALAQAEGFAVVLDVQPGHAPILEELERIRPYLTHPHVHLALDPEFTMGRTAKGLFEVPGRDLGALHPEQINAVQERLEAIAQEIGVNKVLVIHQFEERMVPDKEMIVDYPHVEVVIDSDGFGGPDKIRDYEKYAQEPGFEYGGFKLYRNWDRPLLAPAEVLGLEPPPHVVIYQ